MADVLDTITKLINSPPGQLVAGGVLAGIVWKFFERVESLLTDQTKLEVAVWLLDVNFNQMATVTAKRWPRVFVVLVDRLFGNKHPSLKGLWRSCLLTLLFVPVGGLYLAAFPSERPFFAYIGRHIRFIYAMAGPWEATMALGVMIVSTLFVWTVVFTVPNYISIIKSRWTLVLLESTPDWKKRLMMLLFDVFLSTILVLVSLNVFMSILWLFITSIGLNAHPYVKWSDYLIWVATSQIRDRGIIGATCDLASEFYSVLFVVLWYLTFFISGIVLRSAARFDVVSDWLTRRLDIEHKPLSSIGLVAGALVAVAYWAAVIVARFV